MEFNEVTLSNWMDFKMKVKLIYEIVQGHTFILPPYLTFLFFPNLH